MSLKLENWVNRPEREGELPACLPACSMATIVHCTFSEPTRAEAISTQILLGGGGGDSKPRSEGGRGNKGEGWRG